MDYEIENGNIYFDELYKILVEVFPLDERRSRADAHKLLSYDNYYLKRLTQKGVTVGVISYWILDDFTFIEHFAIKPIFQNLGIGFSVIQNILTSTKRCILEVELPNSEAAEKRILFYKKLGFYANKKKYFQPSYHNGSPIQMMIMSYPSVLNNYDYYYIKKNLYEKVYQVTGEKTCET